MQMVEPIGHFEDIRPRHFNIEDDDVRTMLGNRVDHMLSTLETCHAAELPVDTKLRFQTFNKYNVIVYAKHSHRCLRCIARKCL